MPRRRPLPALDCLAGRTTIAVLLRNPLAQGPAATDHRPGCIAIVWQVGLNISLNVAATGRCRTWPVAQAIVLNATPRGQREFVEVDIEGVRAHLPGRRSLACA